MSHDEQVKEAVGELVNAAYLTGLAVGSGREVFSKGRVLSLDDLRVEYREAGEKVARLLAVEEV